jgi:serine/threonine-protein kinase SRPK3
MDFDDSKINNIDSLDSDDLTVSSDELDYQIDNINLSGEIIKKQYAIIKKVGKGSFANVWLAYDTINNIFVAIKVQHPDNYDEGIEELKFLMKIGKYNHPFINNVMDGFIEVKKDGKKKKKYICMVFQLLAANLYDIIKEGKYSHGLPITTVKSITKQLLLSIRLINKKMDAIHGDIKPENILIEGTNKTCQTIIEEYSKLDFKNIFTNKKNEFLEAKGINPSNKAKVKKAFNRKIKSKIKKVIHANFMSKIQIYLEDSSSDDESSFSDDDLESDDEVNVIKDGIDDEEEEAIIDDEDSVEESESDDEESDDEESDDEESDDEDYEVVDDKFIDNCKIKLSDFGNACYNDEKYIDEFGTRYYRAPEIILEHEYNNTCDIWAVGCTIFELITGDLLFNPEKDKINNRDVHHLNCIQKLCGKIPKDFIKKCGRKDDFFDNKYNLKNIDKPEQLDIKNLLIEEYDFKEEEIKDLIDLLTKIFVFQPEKRISVEECLSHSFLNK